MIDNLRFLAKAYCQKTAIRLILRFLPFILDTKLQKVIVLVAKSGAGRNIPQEEIEAVKNVLQTKHPLIELARTTCSRSGKCWDRFATNLFINSVVYGRPKREAFKQSHDCPAPFFFVISPTMRCNLRCTGCYAGSYEQREELSFDVIDRILTDAEDMGTYFISVSGGEPFIRKDLLELCRKHDDLYFQVYTNGTLVDERLAKQIAKLGNVAPCISVEGFEQETDYRRGKGTFNKVIKAMESLRKEGIIFGFSAMPTRYNASVVASEEFFKFYMEQGCSFCWLFQYIPIGRDPDTDLMMTPEQRLALRSKTREVRNKYPIFIGDFWNDGDFTKGCIAGGRNYFHINARGDVEPCIFVHMAVDNIKQKSLIDVINSPYFKAIRARQPYSENLLRPCMIIDHPHVLRGLCKDCQPYSTDGPVCGFIDYIAGDLDKYSKDSARILDPVWEREFAGKCLVSNKSD